MEPVQEPVGDAKRRRVGELPGTEELKKEEPEQPGELETDAAPLTGKTLDDAVRLDLHDATLNVVPSFGGEVLTPLVDGGLQYLVAGGRYRVGIKAGRYLFEVKIYEALHPIEPAARGSVRPPAPRQLVRVGFSTWGSSLFLGENEASICFDSEGFFTADGKRTQCSTHFARDQVIGVLLNLDSDSPNGNTVSCFCDGRRVSTPQPLPEGLRGKVLHPHVNFKNVTLHMNFGPAPSAPLPFTCHMVQGMALADAEVLPATTPKDGKYEAIFPIGLPDEGTFERLDVFLSKNPQYTELSDRAIVDWALKSGLQRPKPNQLRHCNDKPEMNFGIPMMDDFSIRRVLNAVVTTQPRHYVVMEVKSNLIKEDRATLMNMFMDPCYKKVAQVAMGEPDAEYKDHVQQQMLKEKQTRMELEWSKRKLEMDRKRAIMKKQKEIEAARKRELEAKAAAEAAAKAAAEAAAKAAEEAAAKAAQEAAAKAAEDSAAKEAAEAAAKASSADAKAGAEAGEGDAAKAANDVEMKDAKQEPKDGEAKEEAKKEVNEEVKQEVKEDVKQEVKEEAKQEVKQGDKEEVKNEAKEEAREEAGEAATQEAKEGAKDDTPKEGESTVAEVKEAKELGEEEKQEDEEPPVAQLTEEEKATWFQKGAFPDITTSALSTSFTSFSVPDEGEGFDDIQYVWQNAAGSKEYMKEWLLRQKIECRIEDLQPSEWFNTKWTEWQKVFREWNDKQTDHRMKVASSAVAPQKEENAEGTAGAKDATKEGGEAPKNPEEGQEKSEAAPEKDADMHADSKADDENLDISSVKDVCDIGAGVPLFADWQFEDWTLLTLRVELHLMAHGYKVDARDPERVGIHEQHLPFYYNKYFRKLFNLKLYNMNSHQEVVDMVKDSVTIDTKIRVLQAQLKDVEPFDTFVKLTEESRRDRQRRIEAGDDNARIKFTRPEMHQTGASAAGAHVGVSHFPRNYNSAYGNRDAQPRGNRFPNRASYGTGAFGGVGKGGPYAGGGAVGGFNRGMQAGKGYGGVQSAGYGAASTMPGGRRVYGYGKGCGK